MGVKGLVRQLLHLKVQIEGGTFQFKQILNFAGLIVKCSPLNWPIMMHTLIEKYDKVDKWHVLIKVLCSDMIDMIG